MPALRHTLLTPLIILMSLMAADTPRYALPPLLSAAAAAADIFRYADADEFRRVAAPY